MKVELIKHKNRKGFSLVPETDLEEELVASLFFGKENRKVVVKSGISIGDIVSLDVFVED